MDWQQYAGNSRLAVDEVKVLHREVELTQRTLGKIERSAEAFKGATPFACSS